MNMQHFLFRRFLWALLACALLCCQTGPACFAADTGLENTDSVSWLSYETALSRAKAENKKIFLYFYTDRCPYCKVMNTKTLKDDRVIELLNNQFLCAKVNLDKSPSLGAIYPVSGVPTSWFLESSGKKIGGRPGYSPPEMFLDMLKLIVDEKYK